MRNDGFTLVEIVVSLAIIGITMVVLLSAFNKTISVAAENNVITSAVMLGSEKMASLDALTLPDNEDNTWKTDKRYPRFDFRSSVSQTPFPDVSFVRLTVRYDGKEQFKLDRYLVKK